MITGRLGHARVAVLSIIEVEMDAVVREFCAYHEVHTSGAFTSPAYAQAASAESPILPYVVARCEDRTNTAAMASAQELLEAWRPEYVILCGIAGGIRRGSGPLAELEGPALGDVVVAEYVHYADYGSRTESGFSPRAIPVVHPPTRLVRQHTEGIKRGVAAWPNEVTRLRPGGSTDDHPEIITGEIVAGESIAGAPQDQHQRWLVEHFAKAVAVDMESYGVARALHGYAGGVHYRPEWFAVRGISDHVLGQIPDGESTEDDNYSTRQQWKPYAAATAAHVARRLAERLLVRDRPEHPVQPGAPAWSASAVSVARGTVAP